MNANPENRQRLLLTIAGAALVLFLSDNVIVTPLRATWKARAEKIQELEQRITRGQQLIAEGDSTRKKWDEMEANTLPSAISLAEDRVFKALNKWSLDSQLNVTSIKPQWKRVEEGYKIGRAHV